MISINKYQLGQHSFQGQNKKQILRTTFGKYKSTYQSQMHHNSNTDHKIQQIFSSFRYSSTREMKLSMNTCTTKFSTVQSIEFSQCTSNFDFGSFLSVSQQNSNKKNSVLKQQLCQDNRKPAYIRNFSKLNSIIPNFHHPHFCIEKQSQNLLNLLQAALSAIKEVFTIASKIAKVVKSNKNKSSLNNFKFTLNYFLYSGWQKANNNIQCESLKPTQNFSPNFCFSSIFNKLGFVFNKVVQYSVMINLNDSPQKQLQQKIRTKLQQYQRQLIECSNSLYLIANSRTHPEFYYTYLKILKQDNKILRLEEITKLKEEFKTLWKNKEPIIFSEIGRAVFLKLLHTEEHLQESTTNN